MRSLVRAAAVATLALSLVPAFASAEPGGAAPLVRQGARANLQEAPSAEAPGLLARIRTYLSGLGARLRDRAETGAQMAAELTTRFAEAARTTFSEKVQTLKLVWGKLADAGQAAIGYLKALAVRVKAGGSAALRWCGIGTPAASSAAPRQAAPAQEED